MRRIRELEFAKESLEKRLMKLEEKVGLVVEDKIRLASQVKKLEEENDKLKRRLEEVES